MEYPSLRRTARWLCLGSVVFALSARAQPLTEDEVLEASANLLAVASERLDAQRAEARAEGAGRLSNPTLRFERQESFSPNAQSQDVLSVTWPLPLSGRPRMERSLAHVDGAFARLRRAAMLRTERSALLRVFYAGLAAQARVAILQSGEDALQAARNVIAARVAAGDSAGYDQARIELEVELSRSRIAEARANARSDARRLAFLLGRDTETFAGDFRVSAPAPMNQLIERARAQRSDLRALREVEQSARRAGRISRRAALPDIALIAGYNRQAQPVGQGYVLGAELTLPLFDRNQSAVREAEALQSGVDGLLQAIERTLRGEVAQAHARLTALLEERERFSQAVRTDAILRAALAGYREGEVSLVELLDARRAVVAAALRKLELDLAVRLADVALRQSTGALE